MGSLPWRSLRTCSLPTGQRFSFLICRARLKPGDVLEFDPDKNDDWVLASYRNVPEGFSATLPVRHADGTRSVVAITPERVAYLPRTYDRIALLAHLCALAVGVTFGLIVVTVCPSLMSW